MIFKFDKLFQMNEFFKMEGTGNNFILLHYQGQTFKELERLTQYLCHQSFGIGADGVLWIYPPHTLESPQINKELYHMKIINRDGSYAQMCGNGLRCFSALMNRLGYCKQKVFTVSTDTGSKDIQVEELSKRQYSVKIAMGKIQNPSISNIVEKIAQIIPELKSGIISAHYLLFNVPHIVIFLDPTYSRGLSLDKIRQFGKLIQQHFNANINFAHKNQFDENFDLIVRTFERGAGLTLACGTGVCSVYVIGLITKFLPANVSIRIKTDGGLLEISEKEGNVLMKAPAKFICKGEYFTNDC